MEAARVAAERGHEVTLLERAQRLGGQTASAAAPPERPHYGRHIEWLERELVQLDVDVRLETEATVDSVLDLNPDAVILANGSRPVIPSEADGVEARCATDVEVLDGSVAVEPDARVLVYDREGKYRGGSIANFVVEAGASRVELVTPLFAVCEDLDEVQKPATFRRLAKNDVVLSPNQLLAGQRDGHLLLSDEWSGRKRVVEEADLIVFVGYQAAEDTVFEAITNASPDIEVHVVGDAVAPRRLNDAVLEGVRVGSTI